MCRWCSSLTNSNTSLRGLCTVHSYVRQCAVGCNSYSNNVNLVCYHHLLHPERCKVVGRQTSKLQHHDTVGCAAAKWKCLQLWCLCFVCVYVWTSVSIVARTKLWFTSVCVCLTVGYKLFVCGGVRVCTKQQASLIFPVIFNFIILLKKMA